jgi:hypothetical protein
MLMMRGTVTKNPVMKRRRSQDPMCDSGTAGDQPQRDRCSQHEAVPRED